MDHKTLLNSGNPVPGAPIQLISQENGKFRINNQALDILKSLNGSIAICSVVGPYRTGKSYILNLLLNRPNGFVLGSELVSCTRGIWMWDTPIKHKNDHGEFNLILLDTEGLQSFDSTPELDNMIFVLCLLLSSLFVYNTKNVIDRDAIRKLGIMTDLSRHIDSGSGDIDPREKPSNAADVRDMIVNLPDFIWSVRDVFLDNKFASSNEYLNFALEMDTKNENNANIREAFIKKLNVILTLKVNFIKTAIKSSFKSLNCFLIPIPINGDIEGKSFDEALKHLENVQLKNLRQDFRLKINELCSYIKNEIGYKNLLGVPLSAPAFVAYMEKVVKALNENKQVKIIDSMMASIEYASKQSLDDALIMYEIEMADFLSFNLLPLEWKDLEAAHRRFYEKAMKILEQNLNGENDYTKKYFDQFNQNICVYEGEDGNRKIVGGKYFLLRVENSKQIKKYFKDKLNISWNEIMEKTRANKTENVGEEFGKCYNNLLKSHNEEKRFASSAEKSEAFSEWYEEKDVDRVMESIKDLSEQIKQRIKIEIEKEKEVSLRVKAEQDKEEANRQWKADKEENERKLKEIEERNKKTRENLERQLRRPLHRPKRRKCTIS